MLVEVVGCSHHGVEVSVREQLAFGPEQMREALDRWRREFPGVEAALVSTCNRVEWYAAAEPGPAPTFDEIAESFLHALAVLACHGIREYTPYLRHKLLGFYK